MLSFLYLLLEPFSMFQWQNRWRGRGGGIQLLTPDLDAKVHFCLRRMRDRVAAELDVRTDNWKQIRLGV